MAKLSADKTYVIVEKGDTLSEIARDYAGGASNYKKLAAINNISNPDLIYINQKIKLTSSGGSSTSKTNNSNKPTIKQFGLLSTDDTTLFATWEWNKSKTASYNVLWTYDTGNGVWFSDGIKSNKVEADAPELSRQSTYKIPTGAKKVRFKVKPISETEKKNNKEVNVWTAEWSSYDGAVKTTWTDSTPLETPGTPEVTIEKYTLTASLSNLTIDVTGIEFEIVKKDPVSKTFKPFGKTGKATIVRGYVSYSCTVDAGGEYMVRCRAYKETNVSDWSAYVTDLITIPAVSSGITTIRASSETSVYLEWGEATAADSYEIEYTTKKEYFNGSNEINSQGDIKGTSYTMSGLETGKEYFFRVRAINEQGESAWSEPKSVVVGSDPEPPTTWSSTTTAITGEEVILYWVHNSEDGSVQTSAQLELDIDGTIDTYTLSDKDYENSIIKYTALSEDDLKDGKTHSCILKTTAYEEGSKIKWRVRTAGITKVYSDWSVQRLVDIYSTPTLSLYMTDADANDIDVLTTFPFYIRGVAGLTATQSPIGYHLAITANETYETTDNVGNSKVVNAGEQVYSKYFDTFEALLVEFTPGNIDLENNIGYTVTGVVSMNSGLTAKASLTFTVNWADIEYEPNASIGIDPDSLTASIRPYCDDRRIVTRKVTESNGVYTVTEETLDSVYGELIPGAKTVTGEPVYSGTTADGELVYYCTVEEVTPVTDVYLSVYRREFDGSFTELASGLDGAKATTITDPHPALDFARYRIVATSKTTGAVSHYDPPGYPVGGVAVIMQWNEAWSSFETTEEDALEQPAWSGSLLKLPYDIDVSDATDPDVEMIEYIGRSHPVAYYGTQRRQTSTWSVVIEKDDKETLYGLRRLANWLGDVYVREPSGSGYWAHVVVSFEQQHVELTVPVTLTITRVEGGI